MVSYVGIEVSCDIDAVTLVPKTCVMVINVTSCKSKMVVILATSLALGVSAVAACVVPWLYCKPADTSDDDREVTAIGDKTDSQSRSNKEHDCPISTVGLRVNGSNFVVYINPGSTVNPQFMSIQNETANSTSFNAYLPQNPMNGESRLPVRVDEVRDQGRRDVDPCIAGVANVVSTALNTKNYENVSDTKESIDVRSSEAEIMNSEISESNTEYPDSTETTSSNRIKDTEESRDAPSLEVVVRDIQMIESRSSNSEPTESSFTVKVEVNGTDTQQTTQSSNPTDESSTETTLTASSGASGLDHSKSNIQTDDQSAEKTRSSNIAKSVEPTSRIARSTKMESTECESTDPGLLIPRSLERGSIDRSKENASTPLQAFDPSDPNGGSSTEKTDETSTPRESERSAGSAEVESLKISKDLDTISEVSSCSESSQEAAPCTTSSRAVLRTSNKSPDSAQPVSHNHQNCDIKKMSRRARVASRLSNGFKRFFHGIRLDRTPRSSREEFPRGLHTESVHSVSAGEKFPAGHSTLIGEDHQLLNNIRKRRSMTSDVCLPKTLEDPRIFSHDHRNIAESGLQGNEDLPIHDLSVSDEESKDEEKASDEKDFDGTSDGTGQVLRKVKRYLKARISGTSGEETSRSDLLSFNGDTSKPVGRDENQNFSSGSLTAVNDANLYENRECIGDSEANFNCPKINDGKSKMRSLKNIFKFCNKNRNEGIDKVSHVGGKKTGANSVPAEFQRNSMGMSSKPGEHPNANFENTTSESRVDSHSCQELDFGIFDDERNLQPCTEL